MRNLPLKKKSNTYEEEFVLIELDSNEKSKLDLYSVEEYCKDVRLQGLKSTWEKICSYVLNGNNETNRLFNISNLSELYEIGLAVVDKQHKKENGQYYTPNDVATVMAEWLDKVDGENICDVGCGTGNLVLSFFDYIGKERATKIIKEGRLFLYEKDCVALNICKTILLRKYGCQHSEKIHAICGDFLDKKIVLPQNAKVISNPPYSTIGEICESWEKTDVLIKTSEYYSAFFEKILKQSVGSVVITPYSFLGATKFYTLRKELNESNGFIVSFDNVPGNIFCGKKHGVFNTNTSNSVRAAITVVKNEIGKKGFRLTPLIRFKNEERKNLLKCEVLESFLHNEYQVVGNEGKYYKCYNKLSDTYRLWTSKSNKKISDYVYKQGKYKMFVPNTCRYFTVASVDKMKRSGQISLTFADEMLFYFVFCMINSSFAYWHWRLYDGGITYTKSLLLDLPLFYDLLTDEDKLFFKNTAKEMIENADNFIVKKNNVGVQENIKYPRKYRDKINEKLLNILGSVYEKNAFDFIHSNTALKVNV